MFDKPEEWMVAFLSALWLVVTFFAAQYLVGEHNITVAWLITALSTLCIVVGFLAWKYDIWLKVYPIFLGLLVLCWSPLLDLFASQSTLPENVWYTTWPVKITLALVPIIIGYALKYRREQQRKLNGEI